MLKTIVIIHCLWQVFLIYSIVYLEISDSLYFKFSRRPGSIMKNNELPLVHDN